MDLGLAEYKAIVNGASQGIGLATATLLAEEGAVVAVVARREDRIREAAEKIRARTGGEVHWIQGDIRSPEDCERIVAESIAAMGGVDVLVNNDGAPPVGELASFDDAAWAKAVDRNLMSVVRMDRAVVPSMRERGGGAIVNVTALSVLQPISGFGLSVATWAAVLGFSKTLADEVAGDAIRVNTVCPGALESPRVDAVLEAAGDASAVRSALASAPLGRLGLSEEVASLITFLASPRSSYLTGMAVQVDGGARRSLI